MARRHQLDLTEQQHRVLDLMAHGRTNYDIAQDLGVSLEGAKYHIRQVFDKLGVDSREEAIAAWKDSRGSIFARVRGFLWPVGALAAGGVVVVAIVVVAAAALIGGSSSNGSGGGDMGPGIWVAAIKPAANAPSSVVTGALEVFKAGDKAHARIFAGTYMSFGPNSLQWSSDGKHVAVTRFDGDQQHTVSLSIFTREDAKWTVANVPGTRLPPRFGWSPAHSMLAVMITPADGEPVRVSMMSPAGKALATVDVPAGATGTSSGGPFWSPDGQTATWEINSTVVVLKATGAYIYDGTGDALQVLAKLTGASPTPTAERPTPGPSVVAALHQPASVHLTDQGVTADGTGLVFGPAFGLETDTTQPDDYQIAVKTGDGKVTIADLGQRLPSVNTTLRGAYDVVITK